MSVSPVSSSSRWQRALYLPLTILAWLAVVLVVIWLLRHVAHTVVLIVLAGLVAFALAPLVVLFRRRLGRPAAIAGAYLVGVAIVLGLSLVLVYTAAQQVVNLVQNLPTYMEQAQGLEPQVATALRPLGINVGDVQSINQQILTAVQRIGATVAAGSLGVVSGLVEDIVDAVLILMLSIYFTLAGPRIAAWMQEASPEGLRLPARLLIQTVSQVVGGYIRGTLTMALLIGLLVGVGLAVLGIPYAVLLGLLAFFMQFVPVVGVLISGGVSLLVALPRGAGITLAVLVYFVVVHVIESDVVGPRVMGRAVGIHPATGIIALLAGSELFGVWGALFASPLAGLLQAAVIAVWRGITEGGLQNMILVDGEQEAEAIQPVEDHRP